jgi:hypothetical protein
MFKAILAYLLIFTALAANLSQLLVYAGFELNQNYIISELCTNRDKPQLHCNGKCYLMRKLKQAEQKEKNRDLENQRSMFQLGIVVERLSFSPYVVTIVKEYRSEIPFRLPQVAADIFQPPRA